MGVTIADRSWLLGARKMRQDDDEDFDDAGSMVSIETGRTNFSDDAEFYDTYTKSDGEDAAVDEAIEELTEKRYLLLFGISVYASNALVCCMNANLYCLQFVHNAML